MSLLQDTEFVSGTTVITEAWIDGINDFCNGVKLVTGETFTAGAFRTSLGSTTVGDAVFIAANAAAGRTALVAAGSVDTLATSTLGYTTGAGGTVTQVTNKTTTVTLNKASGKITMDAASLGANTTVTFQLTNSVIGANDVIIVNVNAGSGDGYNVWAYGAAAGLVNIALRNVTAGALAEAVVISFVVIKGVVT